MSLTPVAAARAHILAACKALPAEEVDLRDIAVAGAPRVLAARLTSTRALPPRDNSAMDGYAVGDLAGVDTTGPLTLPLVGESRPGHARTAALAPVTACAITTGGTVPPGTFAVVMRELCDEREVGAPSPTVTLRQVPHKGEHIRRRGEDVDVGVVVGAEGDALTPARLNLLWSAGVVRALVVRRPRVCVLASGDELTEVGTGTLTDDDIVNSNAWAIAAAVRRLGAEVRLLGIARDSLADHVRLLRQVDDADVVITIGGVSVGSHDFVRPALQELGATLSMWRVAMRPGKPLAFGSLPPANGDARGALVFGLPGNPVSALVTFRLFVAPALRALAGQRDADVEVTERAALADDAPFTKKAGLTFFARAVATRAADGRLVVRTLDRQGSGQVSGLADANCLACFGESDEAVAPGDGVSVLWL